MMLRPLFSVILPTWNRPGDLLRALQAWENQSGPGGDFELLVVDDGSGPSTARVLAEFRPQRFQLRCFRQENSGPAAARNRALSEASGRYVLFTGDDIEASPELLESHARAHAAADEPRVAVLGHTAWPSGLPLSATMRHIDGPGAEQFSYYWMKDGESYDFRHFYTSNISLRRELTELEPSGFSTEFPAAAFEDVEYGYRLSRHGMRIFYARDALAFHHHSYNVEGFFKRQLRCGEMAALLWKMRPELGRWLSIGDLERLWEMLALTQDLISRKICRIAEDLEAWESRAISLARLFDRLDSMPRAMDDYLHRLFRYAFLRGLAFGVGRMPAQSAAAAFLRLMPEAAGDFEEGLKLEGLFPPAADLRRILSLA